KAVGNVGCDSRRSHRDPFSLPDSSHICTASERESPDVSPQGRERDKDFRDVSIAEEREECGRSGSRRPRSREVVQDPDVLVSVGAALLVVEPERVQQLVLNRAVIQAALPVQRHRLGVAPTPH
ncbi:ABC transporter B family member 4, partial [Dissostichus eleginoides]